MKAQNAIRRPFRFCAVFIFYVSFSFESAVCIPEILDTEKNYDNHLIKTMKIL